MTRVSDRKIELREMDKTNYREVFNLKVSDDQTQFVAANTHSLAQALFPKEAWYRGIYAGDTAVGFVMLELNYSKPEYYLWRFTIDKKISGKGLWNPGNDSSY